MCIQDGLGLNETWPGFSLRQRKVDLQEGHAFRDSLGKRVMLSLDKDKDMYGAALHRLFRQQKRKRRSRERAQLSQKTRLVCDARGVMSLSTFLDNEDRT